MNVRPETIKCLEENTGNKLLNISLDNNFSDLTPKVKVPKKKKKKQVQLHQTKNFLHKKESHQQHEMATCGSGENIYKLYIW